VGAPSTSSIPTDLTASHPSDPLDEGAELRFDAIADADADGDGDVTLDELALAPAPVTQADTDAGVVTLADLVYLGLTARLAQMAGGPCVADLHQPHE
jgi:hypothetical protein